VRPAADFELCRAGWQRSTSVSYITDIGITILCGYKPLKITFLTEL